MFDNRMSNRIRFNHELLDIVIKRDNCIIDISNYEKINSKTKIVFICKCGNENDKIFSNVYKDRALCKDCTFQNAVEKSKQTSLKRYGVEYPFQSEIIKEKSRRTCLKNYGVEHPMQSKEILEKSKQTCLINHGVERPLQSEEFKEKSKQTCFTNYGVEHSMRSEEVQEKSIQTSLKRYNTEYPFQSEEVKEKSKKTLLENHGVEYSMQSEEIMQKSKQTCFINYGVEHPLQSGELLQKSKQTCMTNYGVEHPMQSEKLKEKAKQTCLNNYGVEHAMQHAEFAEKSLKSSHRTKNFTFPDGTVVKTQGYENIALQKLLDSGYKQEDIITSRKEVPKIWYNQDNKKHRYYCDIFIKSDNKIIEVKCNYTYKANQHKNELKKEACKENGYIFEYWIINNKDHSCEII